MFFRTQLPIIICFVMGVFMIVQFFVPHQLVQDAAQNYILKWDVIVWTFTLFLSGINLFLVNAQKVYQRREDWVYKIVLLTGFLVTLVAGFAWGPRAGTPFDFIYQNMVVPLQSTMFALLAFFVSSAAYRAFRARTLEATLLLVAAFIVMLGRIPIGDQISRWIPEAADWVMTQPNMAAQRGILMGAALGGIATGLRMLVGIERGYFGGGG
jgi:hypothetical protein